MDKMMTIAFLCGMCCMFGVDLIAGTVTGDGEMGYKAQVITWGLATIALGYFWIVKK